MQQPIHTGYLPSQTKLTFSQKLTSVAQKYNSTGQWLDYLPPQTDQQNLGIEAEDCTSHGVLNALEIFANFLFGDTTVWSKRYLAWASGTTVQGNSPDIVFNTLANPRIGTVPQSEWPQSPDITTWQQLYVTPPKNIQTEALAYPAHYSIGAKHIATDVNTLMDSLELSPVSVAGYAWEQNAQGLYVSPDGFAANHFFVLVGYLENQYWLVFDSYENDVKKLAWDYHFAEAITYSMTNNVVNENAWQKFWILFKEILGVETASSTSTIQTTISSGTVGTAIPPKPTPSEVIYNEAKSCLGKHLTLNPNVPPEVGCAEAVSFILLNCGYDIPAGGIPTVQGLIDWMLASGKFQEKKQASVGCVVTATGNPQFAHIGIALQYGVGSNTSDTDVQKGLKQGMFQENYPSVEEWQSSFETHGSDSRFFVAL